jgi:hypothetical protein
MHTPGRYPETGRVYGRASRRPIPGSIVVMTYPGMAREWQAAIV